MVKRLMKEVVFLVTIGLQVITRPFPDNLPIIYLSLGENYNERVMPSIIHETLKAVVAQYNASQLITQREVVSREIRKLLTERATNFNIALDDVFITILSFGKEFTHGIEAKQVAAQEAERAKFIVEKAEQYKKSFVIRAQDIAIDATTTIGVDLGQGIREVDIKKYIKVEKVPGDQLEDYKVLKGVMFNKNVVAPGKMRRKIANPRIILLDCPLEYLSFLFYFLKQIEDLQEKYDAQLHESTELSKRLDATEKSLNHTSKFLASAKESLKQSQYFLEEKDFIITEESKAEISLANEA